MAKRRKLTAPSAQDLSEIEAEFRRETGDEPRERGALAPIAQVAAETAQQRDVRSAETREKLAQAEVFRAAKAQGLVLSEIPLDAIKADHIFRDRTVVSRAELDELRESIRANGLRLPIEVFALEVPEGAQRYGLISGYRRLLAMRELAVEGASVIKAIVRERQTSAERFAAVIEENEVRAGLSHYERGRFTVLTVQNGVFGSVEEAVDALFPFASKAKRSKVRSFAKVFEEIGDLLRFPEEMTEKQGLRVAAALRDGHASGLRHALAGAEAADWAGEWACLDRACLDTARAATGPTEARGGRPKKIKPGQELETMSGARLHWVETGQGAYSLELSGEVLDRARMERLVARMVRWLEEIPR